MLIPLLLCCAVGISPSSLPSSLPNLDFRQQFTGWEGEGFHLTSASGHGPSGALAVCSSACGQRGKPGLLHRTLVVPSGVGHIRFRAMAMGAQGKADPKLDVLLETPGRQFVPKLLVTADGWRPTTGLLPGEKGRPREYLWPVADLAGQTVRIIVMDRRAERGRYLVCTGFSLVPVGELDVREFARFMRTLGRQHRLGPLFSLESEHFTAIGNADPDFARRRLMNCELLYDFFLPHFQEVGFRIRRPPGRLLVAIFDRPDGMEAYLNSKLSTGITGLYHPESNRLVIYDYGTNRALLAARREALKSGEAIESDLIRQAFVGSIDRQADEIRRDVNIETVMHEAAHQMSFNCGLLNRDGDVPLWVAEGLACYCEPTEAGFWKGIGELNTRHCKFFAGQLRDRVKPLSLRQLIENDDWLRRGNSLSIQQGYAQSWAFFRMLMEEQPKTLRAYLEAIYSRRTPDQRLHDFIAYFGPDLRRMEERHQDYIARLAEAAK